MSRLETGAVLLSVWSGLNFVVAAAVTGMALGGEATALSLVLSESEIQRIDARAVAVVNAQAALANPCICALCILVLVITWTNLVKRTRWALFALIGTLIPLQAFGFISDAFLGHRNLVANGISSALLCAALTLATLGLRGRREGLPQSFMG